MPTVLLPALNRTVRNEPGAETEVPRLRGKPAESGTGQWESRSTNSLGIASRPTSPRKPFDALVRNIHYLDRWLTADAAISRRRRNFCESNKKRCPCGDKLNGRTVLLRDSGATACQALSRTSQGPRLLGGGGPFIWRPYRPVLSVPVVWPGQK